MNYPEATGITSRSPRTSQALDKVLSWTLILFALFCSFSISLTQLAAFSGLGILLIRTGLNQSWRQLNWTLMGPVSGLLMAGVLSAVSGVNPEYRLLIFKKVALLLIFFWVVNAFRYFDLKFLQRFIERLTKSDNHSDSKSASSNAGNTHFYLIVAIYLLIAAVTVAALYGFAQAFQHGVSPETRNFIRGNFSHVFTFSALLMMGGLLTFAAVLFGPHKNNLWLWAAALIISTCLLITFTR
ncbi:MAG: hypothetical protein GWM98_19475, partial [Nitrospinaceae bacterium]|nr:hypothetical protein [Nitrospinaceae bacterium]NIR56267.1 hypothetical protein [Nitrospinaceae bacterium]NIS86723.1 hypothetical protein [Nitrospinaceae bacterium]NIT83556.1 hypothetical protein [Nitrospinaceae bacterium]NIU45761.1 hypothetical protein [Nitrospinaceae bacterium]